MGSIIEQKVFKAGNMVPPGARKRAFMTENTHARIRHDYASWHPDHLDEILKYTNKKNPLEIPYGNKSKFDSAQIIPDAVEESNEHVAEVGKNGNFVIVFDMGYVVGFDAVGKRSTSCVTVVTKQSGEVITVHPGTPWSKPFYDEFGNIDESPVPY